MMHLRGVGCKQIFEESHAFWAQPKAKMILLAILVICKIGLGNVSETFEKG
jgi:hypothetical protein